MPPRVIPSPRRLRDVLSIGKVGGGQGDPRYYIDNVATGKDDYYTGHGEAQGQWEGRSAEGRGLTGGVDDEQFLNLLTERARPPPDRRPSWPMT
jgi:hypothetical protein